MTMHYDVETDYSRDELFDELGLKRLKESYMMESETSPQERFAFVSKSFSTDAAHAQRLYEYSSKHWLSYSTPILSFGRTKYGLPISCFLSWIPDTAKGLVDTLSETNWLSMLGGGVGLGFGIRSAGDKSTGVMPHLKTYDASSLAYRQGNCYLPGTEILTSSGWKAMELLQQDDVVAVIDDDGSISFEMPLEIVAEKYNGNIINFTNKTRGIDISVTEDHSMVIERKIKSGWSKRLEKVRASELKFHNEVRFWTAAKPADSASKLDSLTRLKIAIQADAHIRADGVCEFHLKKERKISRINKILSDLNLETWQSDHKDGTVSVYVKGMNFDGLKSLSWINLSKVTPSEAAAMLEEIAEWDATRNREHSFIYFSTIRENASVVQSLAVIAGRPSRICNRKRQAPRLDMHSVFVGNKNYFLLEKLKRENIQYNGMVHCCVVRTGKIVVRAGETPIVCGNTRRGSYAAYLDISHPDILMFLDIRKPTGDQNMRCLNLHHGINIHDDFMKIIERCMLDPMADDRWELREPHSSVVKEVVSAKELWQKILELRIQTGEPYLHFIDTSNRFMPDHLKKRGLKIRQSNLCAEIILPTSEERTAVCCLSSLNLERFDDWKDHPTFLRDVAEMLDNVLNYFIKNAPDEVARAKFSAMRERSIGVGALGFHAYLQKQNIAFESALAKSANMRMFKYIRAGLDIANIDLGKERGEAPDAEGTGKRFSHLIACAPNASSSILMGNTSPSIEPFKANCYRQDTLSGAFMNKNRYLDAIIKSKCEEDKKLDYQDIWSSIISNSGSVQHLEIFDEWTRSVFKTAIEIDQRWIIEHAADRQQFIDQGQSVNVFFKPDTNIKYLHAVHFMAWKRGLKTLYYCRSEKIIKADKVSQSIERNIIEEIDLKQIIDGDECLACSG